ncbi:MAG: hypothetical protein NTW87_13050 [Planctomycetota bacterium]|nr:hypothetical protein [Planctomycetota bacterium]
MKAKAAPGTPPLVSATGRAIRRVQAAVAINLTEALASLEHDGGPVYVYGPDGKPVAALISVEHARLIEDFEDRRDSETAAKNLADFQASGEKAVSWEDVKAKAGL